MNMENLIVDVLSKCKYCSALDSQDIVLCYSNIGSCFFYVICILFNGSFCNISRVYHMIFGLLLLLNQINLTMPYMIALSNGNLWKNKTLNKDIVEIKLI